MAKRAGAGVLVARLLLTTLVALASGWCLVVLFAFSSMTGVSPSGSARWWCAALDKLFLSFDPGLASWPLSAVLLFSGFMCARYLVALLYRIGIALATDGASTTEPPSPPPKGAPG